MKSSFTVLVIEFNRKLISPLLILSLIPLWQGMEVRCWLIVVIAVSDDLVAVLGEILQWGQDSCRFRNPGTGWKKWIFLGSAFC